MKKALVWGTLLAIIGVIIFLLVRPSEKERTLNKPFAYVYEADGGYYFLRVESVKEAVKGQITFYRLIEGDSDYNEEPEIYKEYVQLKGAWKEKEMALTMRTSSDEDEPDDVKAWMVGEDLFLQEEEKVKIRIFTPITEKERDKLIDDMKKDLEKAEKKRQKAIEEAKKEIHEKIGETYGYFYEPQDDYTKWLLVQFVEQDKKGVWTGNILSFDSPYVPNGGTENGVTYPFTATVDTLNEKGEWTFDLRIQMNDDERTLEGTVDDMAREMIMNFAGSSEKMTFVPVTKEEWDNAYVHDRWYRLSDLY